VERAQRRRIDRAVATGAVLVLGVCLLGFVAFTTTPVPDAWRHDPQAARELLALMRAGEHASYVAEYTFTRTLADGRELTSTTFEGHGPSGSLVRSGDSLTIDARGASYDCELVGDTPSCLKKAPTSALAPSEVMRVVIDAGDYDVTRRPGETIAGEHASCFAVTARTRARQLPELGPRTEMCLARDGVPLRNTRVEGTAQDERVARSVVRRWNRQAWAPALAGFETANPPVHG
jgi:hypothetical protein